MDTYIFTGFGENETEHIIVVDATNKEEATELIATIIETELGYKPNFQFSMIEKLVKGKVY